MEFKPYLEQSKKWPANGKHILASYDQDTIVVYQAYKPQIAQAVCKNQNFHSDECLRAGYNLERTSWIKTNFLWMMYRSGWATKKDQEHVLAIRIKRDGFEEILRQSVSSSKHRQTEGDEAGGEQRSTKSYDVVLQWDPDHLPNGDKVSTGRRAIQLGMRKNMLSKFTKEFIVDINDMTDFVHQQYAKSLELSDLTQLEIPLETVYLPKDTDLHAKIDLTVI